MWLLFAFFLPSARAGVPTWEDIKSVVRWELLASRLHADAGKVEVKHAVVRDVECFLGEANADVSQDALLDVVADVGATESWSSVGVTEAVELGRRDGRVDYYQLMDVPSWTMASDRFWFLQGVVDRTVDGSVFRWERLVDGGPYRATFDDVLARNPGAVEPGVNVGAWVFQPAEQGTRVSYYLCTDGGGAMPKTVQSLATRASLPDTVGDVVREARRRSGR